MGMILGKALNDGQLLDVHFTRSFYKHMLGLPVSYHDLEAFDAGYYKNLTMILKVCLCVYVCMSVYMCGSIRCGVLQEPSMILQVRICRYIVRI